ncbi:SDR family oxidoreductase [Pedobacter sp. L105]|uniref:SDR family oxidoreductase n=1 Tax=Pedobacter sp. L105 TaxID=1641871 RepID=UPI00131CE298|nr:SDR family oxidoreductase [Pedobacter sp. L105]
MINKEISILGCGWYGMALARLLLTDGYIVKGSSTTAEKLTGLQQTGIIPYLVNFQAEEEQFDPAFFRCSLLVISIPPKRSTAEQYTFLSKIERIIKAAFLYKVPEIIFISSTSVYGDQNEEVNEETIPLPETDSGKAILAAELALKSSHGFTTTIVRFAGLIGPAREPGRFFAGKKDIPNGLAPINLIHLEDCIGITKKIIDEEAFGYTYNACSPDHPSRADFYSYAAQQSGLEKPQFKNELLNWKCVNSKVLSEVLNYTFKVRLNLL